MLDNSAGPCRARGAQASTSQPDRDSQGVLAGVCDLTLERQWEHQAEQLDTSDTSWLLSIASAGRVNIPCEAFPSRTELVSEDGTGMQNLYPDRQAVSGGYHGFLQVCIHDFSCPQQG